MESKCRRDFRLPASSHGAQGHHCNLFPQLTPPTPEGTAALGDLGGTNTAEGAARKDRQALFRLRGSSSEAAGPPQPAPGACPVLGSLGDHRDEVQRPLLTVTPSTYAARLCWEGGSTRSDR